MQITFEAYDRLQAQLEEIPNHAPEWLPSDGDLSLFVSQTPEKYLEFLIWLTCTANLPATDEGRVRMRGINQILYTQLIFLD